MKIYDVFKEYIWLVQTINKYKKISLEEINNLWRETDMSRGNDINRVTFNRHKNAIEDIFGLYIECDRKNGYKYYIGNSHVLGTDSIQNWLLSTLSVNNIISESLSIQDRIQIESIPDERYLAIMIEAMKTGHKVEITYKRFGTETTRDYVFSPYAIKVYQHRWYVLAFFDSIIGKHGQRHEPYFAIFAFDRIEQVSVSAEKFTIQKDFSAKEFFSECFGIVYNEGIKTERVVLRAYESEVFYLRTLPLHHSQKEIRTESGYSDFELFLKPTLDFSGRVLSRGDRLEILEPAWVRVEIKDMHQKALNRYCE